MVIGNDYLLNFDNQNNLTTKKTLHKNIIPIRQEQQKDVTVFGTMHTHLPETGDYITATDICTLMLYAKFAKWKQHIVISQNYVSIWDCEENRLTVLSREAWEKIANDKQNKNN